MTKQEVNNLLAILKANYSYAFKTMTTDEKYLMLNSWTFALQDISADVVFMAVMKLITVSKWIPTIAEVREKAQDMYYEAAYDLMPNDIESRFMSEEEKQRRTTIARNIMKGTEQLCGEGKPELKLRAIMDNPQYNQIARIGADAMAMQGDTFHIEDNKEGA